MIKKPSEESRSTLSTTDSKRANYVVGIGCSAGSLNALIAFVKGIPAKTEAAFIIVQHLSPDFKSIMDEILDKHCTIEIKVASDLTKILKNTVYILEERKYISLADGRILLSDTDVKLYRHPIDYFFKSLAAEYQNRAYGIILSGTGNDGSEGIKELYRVGATCYSQSREDAQFDGMPASAIKTGLVERVATAEQLSELVCSHVSNRRRTDIDVYANKKDFDCVENIFNFVKEQSNIDFTEYKIGTAERRIQHRMGVLEISDIKDYFDYILRDPNEVARLANDMLIGVTQFFRDAQVWEVLLEKVIKPMIIKKPKQEAIRVWVPGCASGEEAFTLSILFIEAMESLGENREIRIFGSDLQRDEYRATTSYRYPKEIQDAVPDYYLAKYFRLTDEDFELTKRVYANVVFTTHNVAVDPPFSNIDLISCRNLLIYFQPSAQKRILSYFHFSLKSTGYLLLGAAESLGPLSDYYHTIDAKLRLYQKNNDMRVTLLEAGLKQLSPKSVQPVTSQSFKVSTLINEQHKQVIEKNMINRIKDYVLETYAPPTIVIDKHKNIVFSLGNTQVYSKKIEAGLTSLNYNSLLHDDLVAPVSSLLKRIEESSQPVRIENIVLLAERQKISIEGGSLRLGHSSIEDYIVVCFMFTKKMSEVETEEERDFRRNSMMTSHITRLDAALVDAKEVLLDRQHDIENLAEELQCSNEELMASNEELQSSNEELQSVNEELFTVNSEYQEKIKEFEDANFDFDTLLLYSDMGVVFLDGNLLIRRFTARAKEFVNVLPLDLNRPFTDLALTFDFDDLHGDINQAKTHLKKVIRTVNRSGTNNVKISINPYVGGNDRLDGIIIIFQMISDDAH